MSRESIWILREYQVKNCVILKTLYFVIQIKIIYGQIILKFFDPGMYIPFILIIIQLSYLQIYSSLHITIWTRGITIEPFLSRKLYLIFIYSISLTHFPFLSQPHIIVVIKSISNFCEINVDNFQTSVIL